MKKPLISVIVGVYNEAGNSIPLIQQITEALQSVDYEIIYVNDGSNDATLAELRSVTHDQLLILDLQRNYGQSLALAAGIGMAQGVFIVTMDGDGQNDPADILPMLHLAEQADADLVMGIRQNRQDGLLLRKWPSRIANGLIKWLMGAGIEDNGCGIKLFRTDLAHTIGLYGEMHRFVGLLAHLEGARIMQMPVRHHPRRIGQSKYGIGRTFRVLSDLVLLLFLKKYLRKPMHLFGGAGLMMLVTSLALCIIPLLSQERPSPYWLVSGAVLFVAGLQFFAFGILSEMQMRTYYESQGKKPYKIRRTYGRILTHRTESVLS